MDRQTDRQIHTYATTSTRTLTGVVDQPVRLLLVIVRRGEGLGRVQGLHALVSDGHGGVEHDLCVYNYIIICRNYVAVMCWCGVWVRDGRGVVAAVHASGEGVCVERCVCLRARAHMRCHHTDEWVLQHEDTHTCIHT